MAEDDDSGDESESGDAGDDSSEGADDPAEDSEDDAGGDDADSGDETASDDGEADSASDEASESTDEPESASVDDHAVAEVETTDDRSDVDAPQDTDAAVVETADDRGDAPQDTDAAVVETADDRGDTPQDTDAAVVETADDRGDVPEAIDRDAAVITASQSPAADRAMLTERERAMLEGDRTSAKSEGETESKGSAKASGGGSGGGGGGTPVAPKPRSAVVTNAGVTSAVKAAKEFLASLKPAPSTKTQPRAEQSTTPSATPVKQAPAKATVAAKAPLNKPTQAQPSNVQASRGTGESRRPNQPQPMAGSKSPSGQPGRSASAEGPREAARMKVQPVGVQQQGGRKVAARMKGNGNFEPPIFASQYYGFWDERNVWQQAGPLSWEEAGHQITAAMSLGRHCFLWDGGLRKWRPIALDPSHAADVVHGTLAAAGWSPESRAAILRGPETWRQHDQGGRGHTEDIVKVPRGA